MVTLIERRKFMETVYKPAGYIQDGLILWLDGINKGASDGTWVDLVGGKVFSATVGVSSTMEDSFYFNGGSLLKYDGTIPAKTIEICMELDSADLLLYTQGAEVNLIAYSSTNGFNVVSWRGSDAPAYAGNLSSFKTLSVSQRTAFGDFVELAKTSVGDWTTGSGVQIGGRDWGGTCFSKGYIHSIRMYNRYLTDTEMLHNQSIDNERFDLGLVNP